MFDLRSFLDKVRAARPSDVVDVRREVSPNYETAAILTKLEQKYRSPILFFHKVAGSPFPLVTNVCGSRARLALALGCALPELAERYARACAAPIKPSIKSSGSVQDIVRSAKDVDLGILPQMVYHENDCGKPYITAAMVVARDPETGIPNLSYHRLMIAGKNKTGIFMERGHLSAIYRKHGHAGEAMPIAAIIGAHPCWSIGAVYSGSPDVDEYEIIGGLQGEPIGLVKCVTQPGLDVPADAEFVLEGRVPPLERIEEGPFGEFTGVSAGTMQTPVFEVSAMTSRKDPIFQDIVSGRMEHMMIPALSQEACMLEIARSIAPGTTRVTMPAPLTVLVGLNKTNDQEPRQIIDAILSRHLYAKHVVVADSAVDLNDMRQLAAAIALNVQADRDVHVLSDQEGSSCDPSGDPAAGRTAKMGIDATGRLAKRSSFAKNTIPQHVLDAVDLREL